MDILEILYILVTYEISDIYNIFDKVWRCIRKLAHFGQIDNSGHICIFRHSSNFGCIDLWKSFSHFGHFGHIHHIWHNIGHVWPIGNFGNICCLVIMQILDMHFIIDISYIVDLISLKKITYTFTLFPEQLVKKQTSYTIKKNHITEALFCHNLVFFYFTISSNFLSQ